MIIIRDLTDIHTLKLQIRKGDILEIYNTQYDITKYYWIYDGILVATYGEDMSADYCYDAEFFRDIRMALTEPDRYLIKLVVDSNMGCTEVVRLEEDALI